MRTQLAVEDLDLSTYVMGIVLHEPNEPYMHDWELIPNRYAGGPLWMNIPIIMSGMKRKDQPITQQTRTYGSVCFKNQASIRPKALQSISESNYVVVYPSSTSAERYVKQHYRSLKKIRVRFYMENMLRPQYFL